MLIYEQQINAFLSQTTLQSEKVIILLDSFVI